MAGPVTCLSYRKIGRASPPSREPNAFLVRLLRVLFFAPSHGLTPMIVIGISFVFVREWYMFY